MLGEELGAELEAAWRTRRDGTSELRARAAVAIGGGRSSDRAESERRRGARADDELPATHG